MTVSQTKELYLMISHTSTGMGRIIRFFTHYGFNHVSLSLDPQLCRWVSFARYVQGVPLAGGFVEESPERFLSGCQSVPVKIYRFEIPLARYRELRRLFSRAGDRNTGLIYNTFGALLTPLGIHFGISGAYTCLEFAGKVLDEPHRSIRSLEETYRDHLIFEGRLEDLISDSGLRQGDYFTSRGPWGGTVDTTRHFTRLCRRLVHRKRPDLVTTALDN